jgi:hypothetical protein
MTRAIVLLLLAWPVLANGTVLVTGCGQTVRGIGELTGDLDCSGIADEAVRLTGRLHLNGFTITGNPAHDVVECSGGCMVEGPGTITGGSEGVIGNGHVRIVDVTVTLNTGDGIHADRNARVTGGTVTNNAGDGIRSNRGARLYDSVVSGNVGTGVQADVGAVLNGSTVTANGADGVTAGGTLRVRETVVGGNALDGVRGRRVVLRDATLTGNATSASCGVTDDCADVASAAPPRLYGTNACGTSRDVVLGGPWGVCTND